MNPQTQRDDAKQVLFKALAESGGDTKDPTVEMAISKLSDINPRKTSIENSNLIEGNWLLINAPNFPGHQPDPESRYIYTLGRLAFNMFEPTELLVEIERVMQPVFPTGEGNQLTHDIVVEFKTIDLQIPELKGIIKNLAICTPKSESMVQVEFTGGELMPQDTDDSAKMQQWLALFGQDSYSSQLSLRKLVMSKVMKWMFGISKVSPVNLQTGKRTFTMKKSPKGILNILYLDEELRITRGNRGTVLVCQRQV